MFTLKRNFTTGSIYLLIAASGFAALSWEVIWQIKSTLALGVSAWGAAMTLAVIMCGMSIGGYLMGRVLSGGISLSAVRWYGLLELMVGVAGLFLNTALHALEKLDTWMYASLPSSLSLIYIVGMIIVFGIPTMCMGATFPVFARMSEQFHIPIYKLYSLNILGAALGALMVAFIIIPLFGLTHTIWIISFINIAAGFYAWQWMPMQQSADTKQVAAEQFEHAPFASTEIIVVFVSGFAIFMMEVVWFRALSNMLPNTADIFAVMLASVLIALGLAAKKVPLLKQKQKSLGVQIGMGGVFILLVTPLIERLDSSMAIFKAFIYQYRSIGVTNADSINLNWSLSPDTFIVNGSVMLAYAMQLFLMFAAIFFVIALPIRFVGVAFPWILESRNSSRHIGRLYAVNTLGAILGAICAAWLFLPLLGFAKTSWLIGVVVVMTGALLATGIKRYGIIFVGAAALLIAIMLETGIGKTRVQGFFATDRQGKPAKVLQYVEGPAATISAVQYRDDGARALLIGSSMAAIESGDKDQPASHYMAWMGYLPMMFHPDPKKALVICFGTGQTANAVRRENPDELDIVDINPNVFALAHHFKSNEGVLNDPRVKAIIMDGRAYMRRTKKTYDVITLEPMPPISVGVNALYSREFYVLARKRLSAHGVIAQWLPFHVAAPHYTASIAKTFIDVFPNAVLWIDDVSNTGILIGTKSAHPLTAAGLSGYPRTNTKRNLSQNEVERSIALDSKQLAQYARYGEVITDDNQLLAYGKALSVPGLLVEANFALLRRINSKIIIPEFDREFP